MLRILMLYGAVCCSSCTLFRPLPLQPVHNNNTVQHLEGKGFAKLEGDYQILAADSGSITLDYAFMYKALFNRKKIPGKNDRIHLSVIDSNHIKATLFIHDKTVSAKTIRGSIRNNYFEFHSRHFALKYIFILYAQQTNRIALSEDGDLFLDTNSGGIGFLLLLPIPLSGSSTDTYNVTFKRKN